MTLVESIKSDLQKLSENQDTVTFVVSESWLRDSVIEGFLDNIYESFNESDMIDSLKEKHSWEQIVGIDLEWQYLGIGDIKNLAVIQREHPGVYTKIKNDGGIYLSDVSFEIKWV